MWQWLKERITFNGCLSAFSFIVILVILFAYIYSKIQDIESITRIFDIEDNQFIWLLVIFVILCNYHHIKEIISKAVKDRLDSVIMSDLKKSLREDFSNDPDMLTRLEEASRKRIRNAQILGNPKDSNISIK